MLVDYVWFYATWVSTIKLIKFNIDNYYTV